MEHTGYGRIMGGLWEDLGQTSGQEIITEYYEPFVVESAYNNQLWAFGFKLLLMDEPCQ